MRRYLVASILGIMIGQYVTLAVVGNPESELKLNHEFSPFMATEPLTTEYRYTLLFSDTERKIYFIQSLPEKPKRYPVHNMLGIYYGKGNLSDLEFVPNKTSLTPYETTPLSMVYPFYPPGSDKIIIRPPENALSTFFPEKPILFCILISDFQPEELVGITMESQENI